jgi:hypothetical protein
MQTSFLSSQENCIFMKQFAFNTLGLATVAVALSGLAIAQDQSQGLKLMSGNSELVHTLSTKSAKQGDPVAIKLTEEIKTPEGVKLPRGTELIGQVDSVKASEDKSPSSLVLTFNQARLKDGKTLAIKATLASFAAAGDPEQLPIAVAPDDTFEQLPASRSGVTLHSAVKDDVSGTLSSNGRNIDLTQGTQFLVAVGVESAQTTSAAE